MLASKNIRPNATKQSEVTHWLRVLASELSVRLLEARERSASLWPKTLVLHVRQSFNDVKSRQCAFPYTTTITPEIISKPAERLFKDLLGTSSFKISNLQLAFSGLTAMESGQRGIEGFFAQGSRDATLGLDVDNVPEKPDVKRKYSVGHDAAEGEITLTSGTQLQPPPNLRITPTVGSSASNPTSFKCGKCQKIFFLSKTNKLLDDDGRTTALEKLKAEHSDFHVAQDLAREVIDVSSSPEQKPPPKKRAKATTKDKPEVRGIAKYFGAPSQKGPDR
ncbi:DNA-directed DNA polymerase eta rad30 [Tulasnella sp. JGI-2019a]|nr:DNA-directed DNA polymerase eta rad30 [Tulasnella sp. JGI-2019a]